MVDEGLSFLYGKKSKPPSSSAPRPSPSSSSDHPPSEDPASSSGPSSPTASSRPRPILIKLGCPWDRRIILASKRKLSGIQGMEGYFLQPDLSVEERKKRRDAYLARRNVCS